MSVLCLHGPASGVYRSVVTAEGQDWTVPARFNLVREHLLILFSPVDFLWFVRGAGSTVLLCHCCAAQIGLKCMDEHAQLFSWSLSGTFPTFFQVQALSLLCISVYFLQKGERVNLAVLIFADSLLAPECLRYCRGFHLRFFWERTASTNPSAVRVQLLEDLAFQPRAHDFFSLWHAQHWCKAKVNTAAGVGGRMGEFKNLYFTRLLIKVCGEDTR